MIDKLKRKSIVNSSASLIETLEEEQVEEIDENEERKKEMVKNNKLKIYSEPLLKSSKSFQNLNTVSSSFFVLIIQKY
jgi:hypothetical protein